MRACWSRGSHGHAVPQCKEPSMRMPQILRPQSAAAQTLHVPPASQLFLPPQTQSELHGLPTTHNACTNAKQASQLAWARVSVSESTHASAGQHAAARTAMPHH